MADRDELASGLILVVDDQPLNVELLEADLSEYGYEVLSAYDGKSALKKVESRQPDLILLDVMMPGMDGFEVCRRLKSDPETMLIPIVMVTALSEKSDRIKGIEAGVDDFLTKPYDRQELQARVKSLLRVKLYTDELERAEAVISSLALSVEAKDSYTEDHCGRLSRYSVKVGGMFNLPHEQLRALRLGGILHDVGKIGIPDAILQKKGKLTDEEFATMREHPMIGFNICKPLRSLRHVLPIIRHHHERLDGSGYPDGLKGEKIPLTARILTVVDVYDALRTERPYKPAYDKEKTLAILDEETGKGWYDPEVLSKFKKIELEEQ
ncbi:MAG: response regulator [Candidatus Glassbacteria bacterium]|nr:response regulator [Candidatus Glassbacteria bacterium]